jgi:hypothetical protein
MAMVEKWLCNTGTTSDRRRSGRPRETTLRQDRHITLIHASKSVGFLYTIISETFPTTTIHTHSSSAKFQIKLGFIRKQNVLPSVSPPLKTCTCPLKPLYSRLFEHITSIMFFSKITLDAIFHVLPWTSLMITTFALYLGRHYHQT